MKDAISGWWALMAVTLHEAHRQRLWLLLAAMCVLLLIIIPNVGAVDEHARLKLAVATITGASGFVVTLLGALMGAAAIRRDIDSRIGFMLFAKPLSRGVYIGGRWMGVLVTLLLAVGGLIVVGAVSTWWQLGALPQPQRVVTPSETWRLENGQPLAVGQSQESIILAGLPQRGQGEGLRWRFEGLPVSDADGYELLIRVQVNGSTAVAQSRVALSAVDATTDRAVALILSDESPYGFDTWGEQETNAQQVFLHDREGNRNDLTQDYARFVVPAELAHNDQLTVQLNRLDGDTRVRFDQDSVFIAVGGGSFFGNMVRAELVMLAQAALLVAVSIFIATIAKIGTALLGALTLYFGGSTLAFIEEGMRWENFGQVTERGLQLLLVVLPDFGRFPVEASLAASQQVPWATVGEAWLYYGAYAGVFLIAGWLVLRRAEL